MRILVLIPIADSQYNAVVSDQLANFSKNTAHSISVESLLTGPKFIDSASAEDYAAHELLNHFKNYDCKNIDAIFINCFGDPGVEEVAKILPIPVIGASAAALKSAQEQSKIFSIILPNAELASRIQLRLDQQGIQAQTYALEDANSSDILKQFKNCLNKIPNSSAPIVLGCTAWSVLVPQIQSMLHELARANSIIDPQAAAIDYLLKTGS